MENDPWYSRREKWENRSQVDRGHDGKGRHSMAQNATGKNRKARDYMARKRWQQNRKGQQWSIFPRIVLTFWSRNYFV
jgi:hypothetical protein